MKKTIAIPSILLSSLMAFSMPSFAFTAPQAKEFIETHNPQIIKAHVKERMELRQASFKNDMDPDSFTETLEAINNNETSWVDNYQFTTAQTLEILAALKENTSVKLLVITDEGRYISEGHRNEEFVAALLDVLQTNKTITSFSLDGYRYDITRAKEQHFDKETFNQIAAALKDSSIKDFSIFGWHLNREISHSVADLLAVQSLTGLNLTVDGNDKFCAGTCNTPVIDIMKAVATSNLERISVWTNYSNIRSNNYRVGEELFLSAIQNKNLRTLYFDYFPISNQAAMNLSTAVAESDSLEGLGFYDNNMSDEVFAAMVPGINQNQSIYAFVIAQQHFTNPDTLTSLVNIYNTKSFQMFRLDGISNFAFDADNMASFTNKLVTDQNLVVLELDNIEINDQGMYAIADALKQNTTLGFMSLEGNSYTVDGARAVMNVLETNTALTSLWIDEEILNQMPAEEVALFEERLNRNRDENL